MSTRRVANVISAYIEDVRSTVEPGHALHGIKLRFTFVFFLMVSGSLHEYDNARCIDVDLRSFVVQYSGKDVPHLMLVANVRHTGLF